MKIEILDPAVSSKNWEYEGRSGVSHTQQAYLHQDGQPYPTAFSLKLASAVDAYPAGVYVLNLNESLRVYQGKLQLGLLSLIPAK
jgi:hypothetical protein